MKRPTRPPHDGRTDNPHSFIEALVSLQDKGPRDLTTAAGTPFTAKSHVASKGSHEGEDCILITRDGETRAYIYPGNRNSTRV